jgi:adenylosuccinate synthase
VVDLAFGDCGKGTVVDFLARRLRDARVVRFNGGPQAAHNVVTPDGRHHTFSQFGAGTLAGAATLLTGDVLIEPYALLREAGHLARLGIVDPMSRLRIHPAARVITPAHQAANRLRELVRGPAAHGTCGVGVGERMSDELRRCGDLLHARDLGDRRRVRACLHAICRRKLEELQPLLRELADHPHAVHAEQTLRDTGWIDAACDVYAEAAEAVEHAGEHDMPFRPGDDPPLIFEGAQGVLLDEHVGFHPHTTWSTTTFANSERTLERWRLPHRAYRLGVLRTYFTRHGTGPFVTEDASLLAALPEPHNAGHGWQGDFRVGALDVVAIRYAMAAAGGVDGLVITHLDRLAVLPSRVCVAYDLPESPGDDDLFEREGGRIVAIRTSPAIDLPRQQRLTDRLRQCRPIFAPVSTQDADAFVARMEALLGKPVVLTSFGPTAAEKQLRHL